MLGLCLQGMAQSELTLPFMTDVFQSSYINPAVKPEHKVSVGVSAYGQGINDGLKFDDFMSFPNANSTTIKSQALLDGLRDKGNRLYTGVGTDLHVRFRVQNAFYWFAVREQAAGNMLYPKALFQLPLEGTKPYIGKTLDLTDTRLKSMLYTEYTVGMSMEFKKLVVGGRLSLLKGGAAAMLDPTVLKLQIDETSWANTVESDAIIRTCGLPTDGAPGKLGFGSQSKLDYLKSTLRSKNTGFALSLGATYRIDDNLLVGISAYDLGFINWRQDLAYKLKGAFSLEPLDELYNLLDKRGISVRDSLINKFKDSFQFDTIVGGGDKFRTWLDPKFTLSGTYKLARRTSVGLLLGATVSQKFYPTVTLGVQQGLGRFFMATANISYGYGTLKNFGAGLVVKPGPLQLFVAVDNYFPFLGTNALSFRYTSVRAGINFVFGRVAEPDGMPLR